MQNKDDIIHIILSRGVKSHTSRVQKTTTMIRRKELMRKTKKKYYAILLAVVMLAALALPACSSGGDQPSSAPPPASDSPSQAPASTPQQSAEPASPPPSDAAPDPTLPDKDFLSFGAVRPVSGVFAVYEESVFGPIWRMWVDEVNAAGGIYVAEYGKQLPIEVTLYDDTSDLDTMLRLTERLIVEDQVDFLLPTCSTAFLFAQAALVNNYNKLLITAEGGSAELSLVWDRFPMSFYTLNHAATQIPDLVQILDEEGIESAFIVFINDLHGIEYSGMAVPELARYGIDVLGVKSVPADIQDMSPILNEARNSGADAFLIFAYPDQNMLAVSQAMELGYNPDVFLTGPLSSYEFFTWIYGEAVEGIMGFGAYNPGSSPAIADFIDRYNEVNPGLGADFWGHVPYYAGLEVLQQAIEGAGTIDNEVVAEYIRSHTFETVMGTTWFENNQFAAECYPGSIGQWQNFVFEVIDVDPAKRTADPIVPKPAW